MLKEEKSGPIVILKDANPAPYQKQTEILNFKPPKDMQLVSATISNILVG